MAVSETILGGHGMNPVAILIWSNEYQGMAIKECDFMTYTEILAQLQLQ